MNEEQAKEIIKLLKGIKENVGFIAFFTFIIAITSCVPN